MLELNLVLDKMFTIKKYNFIFIEYWELSLKDIAVEDQ